jgi:hypothetical protein
MADSDLGSIGPGNINTPIQVVHIEQNSNPWNDEYPILIRCVALRGKNLELIEY